MLVRDGELMHQSSCVMAVSTAPFSRVAAAGQLALVGPALAVRVHLQRVAVNAFMYKHPQALVLAVADT